MIHTRSFEKSGMGSSPAEGCAGVYRWLLSNVQYLKENIYENMRKCVIFLWVLSMYMTGSTTSRPSSSSLFSFPPPPHSCPPSSCWCPSPFPLPPLLVLLFLPSPTLPPFPLLSHPSFSCPLPFPSFFPMRKGRHRRCCATA